MIDDPDKLLSLLSNTLEGMSDVKQAHAKIERDLKKATMGVEELREAMTRPDIELEELLIKRIEIEGHWETFLDGHFHVFEQMQKIKEDMKNLRKD